MEESAELLKIIDAAIENNASVALLKHIVIEHSGKLDSHSKMLNEHSKILNEHSKILNEHSGKLDDHSTLLKKLSAQSDQSALVQQILLEQMTDLISEVRRINYLSNSIEDVRLKGDVTQDVLKSHITDPTAHREPTAKQ